MFEFALRNIIFLNIKYNNRKDYISFHRLDVNSYLYHCLKMLFLLAHFLGVWDVLLLSDKLWLIWKIQLMKLHWPPFLREPNNYFSVWLWSVSKRVFLWKVSTSCNDGVDLIPSFTKLLIMFFHLNRNFAYWLLLPLTPTYRKIVDESEKWDKIK